jgi:hypothetical protein
VGIQSSQFIVSNIPAQTPPEFFQLAGGGRGLENSLVNLSLSRLRLFFTGHPGAFRIKSTHYLHLILDIIFSIFYFLIFISEKPGRANASLAHPPEVHGPFSVTNA